MQEAAAGAISVNVVGFSMGNSWIAPDEQTMAYGPMLYQLVNGYTLRLSNASNPLDTFPRSFPVDGKVANLLRTCY